MFKLKIMKLNASFGSSVGHASDWCSGGRGFDPRRVRQQFSWRLIMKYFKRPVSPFCLFKKGSSQFLVKDCAQEG